MTSHLQHSKVRRLVAAWLGLMSTAAPAHDYRSWNPSTDGDVANLANWSGATVLDGNTFFLFDGATLPLHQPTLNSAVTVGGLEFSSNTVSYTLSGTGLLTIGDYDITNSSPVAQTIAVPLTLVGSGYNRINNNGTLTISGAITTNTGNGLKLAGSGANGTVSGAISGSKDVIKYNSGTWTLSGANTFTGNLLVEEGVVNLSGTSTTPRVEVYNGATLNLTAANTLAATTAVYLYGGSSESYGILNVNTSQRIGTLESGSEEDCGWAALVNIGSGATLTIESPDDSTKTYKGTIAGAGGVTKTGSGTQTFGGDNLYSGGTTISGGTLVVTNTSGSGTGTGVVTVANSAVLQIGDGEMEAAGAVSGAIANNGAVRFDRPGTLTHGSVISGGGSVSIAAGTVTLTGANTYSGGTVLNGGTLVVSSDAALGATDGGQPSSVAGPRPAGRGFSGPRALAVGDSGHRALNGTPAGLTFNGGTLQAGAAFTSARGVTLNAGGGTIDTHSFELTFSGVITGTGKLTHQGSGVLTLSGANDYTGGTVVKGGGVLDFTSDANLGTGSIELTGGYLRTRAALADFSHNLLLGAGGGNINLYGFNSTFSGQLTGTGALEVQSQTGNGVLTLTNANNQYTGTTTIASGTLKVGVTNALPTTTGLALGAGATLNVAANQTINRFLSTHATSSIVLETGQRLTVALGSNPGASTQFNGTISGAGSLKIGNAGGFVVALTGDDTYTGGTTIDANAGLQLGDGGTTGMIAGNVLNNGILSFARTNNVSFGGVISGDGVVKQVGSGHLQLTAANTYGGATQVYAGRLLAMNSSGSATGTGSIAVYSGGGFGGNGTVTGPLTVESGGTVAPGTDLGTPATLHAGSTTFAGGATFAFQIKDATGSAGSDYSLLSSSGALTINATSGNPFTISVYSVNGTTQGTTANFDSAVGYSWTFVSAANGITGFDAAAFQVSTTNFQNAFTGSFGVSQAGNSLLLSYTPAAVPEPATWALLGLGLGGVWWWRRRGGAAGRGR